MPERTKQLSRFLVECPGHSEEMIPCDAFFAKNPRLSQPFTIWAPHFDDELRELYTDKAIKDLQAALDMERPLQWHFPSVYLFGNQLWLLSRSEMKYTSEELRLLLLEAIDRERRKFERLRQKFSGMAGAKVGSRREQIPEDVKIFVWRRDEGRCVKCGSQEKLEFDHIIPISKGGSNTERNIQLLCESCNREKSDKI